MKRTLLVLSILFLALWIAGLFYPKTTMSIHIALIVSLLFFIRSVITIQSPIIKETQVKTVTNQSVKNQEQEYSIEKAQTTITPVFSESNKQEARVS